VIDSSTYRLVLLDSTGESVFVTREGEALSLPCVAVPNGTRIVEQLHLTAKAHWGARAIILDILRPNENASPIAVAEVRSTAHSIRLVCINLNEIPDETLRFDERKALQQFLSGDSSAHRAFTRLGWIDEANHWIEQCVNHGHELLNNEVYQLNASDGFALVHFGAHRGRGYWLKATGSPNEHEFEITLALAHSLPHFLPPIIGSRKDWNSWVMEDGGIPLRNDSSLTAMDRSVTALAAFQIQSISQIEVLQVAGCHDQSLTHFLQNLDPMIGYLEEAMKYQISTTVPRLDSAQLRHLAEYLRCACKQMLELDIPDTLVHGDINPGNILLDGEKCVFIDWAEAYIGNPLLTLKRLIVHLAKVSDDAAMWVPHLKKIYKRQWRDRLPEASIDQAFAVAPLLAVATYLYGTGSWVRSSRRNELAFQKHVRSLARHVNRAAQQSGLVEA
jgi:hypothetical protein